MTAYTIEFDDKLDAALENARQLNEPTLTMGEYLAIVLGGHLTNFAKDWEPSVVEAREDLKVAQDTAWAKYEPVKLEAVEEVMEEVKQ